jgi:hypothetical protein
MRVHYSSTEEEPTGMVASGRVTRENSRSLARCLRGAVKSGGDYQEARWGQRPQAIRSREQEQA